MKALKKGFKDKFRYEIWFYESKKGSTKIVKKAIINDNKLEFIIDCIYCNRSKCFSLKDITQ